MFLPPTFPRNMEKHACATGTWSPLGHWNMVTSSAMNPTGCLTKKKHEIHHICWLCMAMYHEEKPIESHPFLLIK